MLITPPQIVTTSPCETALIHFKIARTEMAKAFGPGIQEIFAVLAAQNIAPAGAVFAHHLKIEPGGMFDFELSVPVASAIKPAGHVQPGNWLATRVAQTEMHGDYKNLPDAWGEFQAWIKSNGHTSAPDLYEVYLAGPNISPDPAKWVTQLNRPLL